jgi:hypothetical protein
MAVEVERARRRLTIEEYERMAATGIFAEDERVELVDPERLGRAERGAQLVEAVLDLRHFERRA